MIGRGLAAVLLALAVNAAASSMQLDLEGFSSQLDLARVLNKTAIEQSWSEAFAELVSSEYKRFLFIVYKYDVVGVPSRAVDELWHSHILDTRMYTRDTTTLFGRYLHHLPSYTEEEQLALAPDAAVFKKLYRAEFGEMEPKVWQAPGGCGNCKASADGLQSARGGCGSCKAVSSFGCGSCKSAEA